MLPLSLDRAASIAEAGMVLLLCAPRRMGGYGLPWPVMNKVLPVPPQTRAIVDWPWVACDALWEDANVALEYDGRGHSSVSAQKRDGRRRNVLATLGLSPIVMNGESFCNVDMFDQIAHQLARRIGYRLDKRCFDKTWEARRATLRTEVIRMIFGEQALTAYGAFC